LVTGGKAAGSTAATMRSATPRRVLVVDETGDLKKGWSTRLAR
jgi:hypothetical protein